MSALWERRDFNPEIVEKLCTQLVINKKIAILLAQRGIQTADEARYFLQADRCNLCDPLKLSGVEAACNRIMQALDKEESILIYGDYDVDGICSITLLYECITALGKRVNYYVPDRFSEGYGLNAEALQRMLQDGVDLIITVDCGITSWNEAQFCQAAGLDLIITDHHMPGESLPPAVAIINPKLDACQATKDLAGAGVAFKLACALFKARATEVPAELLNSWLELASLATIADIVPLTHENRIIAKLGLPLLSHSRHLGLQLLLEKLGLANQQLRSWHIGFSVAPKLNAAGRLDSANKSIELLLTDNYQAAEHLSDWLLAANQRRKTIENEIMQQAVQQLTASGSPEKEPILIASGANWNVGVIGIVASRLLERFQLPVIVISWDGEIGRGSCRSLPGTDMMALLSVCSPYLVEFGGHKMAAGLTVNWCDFADFKTTAQRQAAAAPVIPVSPHYFDLELSPEEITPYLFQDLEQLEPFGEGNPTPRLVIRNQLLAYPVFVGKNQEHLRCSPISGNYQMIAFHQAQDFSPASSCLKHDLLFELQTNEFRGRKNLQLNILNFVPSVHHAEADTLQPFFYSRQCLQALADSLASNETAYVLFPDVPTMRLFAPWITAHFNPAICKTVHGFLPPAAINSLFEQTTKEPAQIIMITLNAWLYGVKKHSLPNRELNLYSIDPQQDISPKTLNKHHSPLPQPWWQPGELPQIEMLLTEQIPATAKIYAHRVSTVTSLSTNSNTDPYLDIDASASAPEFSLRLKQRQTWLENPGTIFTNADFIPCADFDLKAKALLAADPFYSTSELTLFTLGEYLNNGNTSLLIHPNLNNFQAMHRHMAQNYPSASRLTAFIHLLATLPKKGLAGDTALWIKEINQSSALQITTPAELHNLLRIAAELNLCEWEKHGNILSIKSDFPKAHSIDLTKSLFYMEGLTSKRTYWEIEQLLQTKITQQT